MIRMTFCGGLLLAIALLLAARPSAALDIYGFGSDFGSTLFTAGGRTSGSGTEPDAIGGSLDRRFEFVAGIGQVRTDVEQVLMHATTPLNTALNRFIFDGDTDDPNDLFLVEPNGLGGVDLSDGGASDAFLIDAYFNDLPSTMEVTVYSNSGLDVATGTLNLTPGLVDPLTATTLSLPFSSFRGPVDFANVGAIVVEFQGVPGHDLLVDNLRTGPTVANPPNPPAPSVAPYQPAPIGSLAIDLFDQGSFSTSDDDGNPGSSGTNPGTAVLGGFRSYDWDDGNLADPGDVAAFARFGYNNNGFDGTIYLTATPTVGEYTPIIHYDGSLSTATFDTAGLGSVDLTDGGVNNALLVGVLFNDVPASIEFTVYSNSGNAVSTATLDIPGLLTDGATLRLAFADFVGNADFSDVSALQWVLTTGYGQDIRIDYIVAVPEPASGCLLAGPAALLLCRRKKQWTPRANATWQPDP